MQGEGHLKLYRHYGSSRFDSEKFKPVTNVPYTWVKPANGLWASPVLEDGETGWSSWCRKACYASYSLKTYFDFHLAPETRIYVIDTFQELVDLVEAFSRDVFCNHYANLDFEKLQTTYDAIYLTDNGEQATRYSQPSLYGWDCASLLVMSPDVIDVI